MKRVAGGGGWANCCDKRDVDDGNDWDKETEDKDAIDESLTTMEDGGQAVGEVSDSEFACTTVCSRRIFFDRRHRPRCRASFWLTENLAPVFFVLAPPSRLFLPEEEEDVPVDPFGCLRDGAIDESEIWAKSETFGKGNPKDVESILDATTATLRKPPTNPQ